VGKATAWGRQIYLKYCEAFRSKPNDTDKFEVDHKNRIRTGNRASNFRWISKSENCKKKSSQKGVHYEYFDELHSICQLFLIYGHYEFGGYSIDEDKNIHLYYGVSSRTLVILKTTTPLLPLLQLD
jgi:hypothetical protein